jgi:hypothetical protein
MKKALFFSFLILLLIGCKSKPATQLDNKTEVMLKGSWIVTEVMFPGSDFFKVVSFELADSKCFEGSTWNFISNNNTGQFTINATECIPFGSPITWFINKEGNFVMKILNQNKAKRVNEGYVLRVSNITENSFQLVDKVNIGGQLKELTYQFKRN